MSRAPDDTLALNVLRKILVERQPGAEIENTKDALAISGQSIDLTEAEATMVERLIARG